MTIMGRTVFCYICKVEVLRELAHIKQLCMTCRDKLREFNIQTLEKDIPYELWEYKFKIQRNECNG